LVPLFHSDSRKPLSVEGVGIPTHMEGELAAYVVVSVPPTETHATAKVIRDTLAQALGRPVLVVSHNMQFLVTRRLRPAEAAKVIKSMEDALYGESRKDAGASEPAPGANPPEAKGLGDIPRAVGDGGGSGPGDDGGGGAAASAGEKADGDGAGSGGHGEGGKESPA